MSVLGAGWLPLLASDSDRLFSKLLATVSGSSRLPPSQAAKMSQNDSLGTFFVSVLGAGWLTFLASGSDRLSSKLFATVSGSSCPPPAKPSNKNVHVNSRLAAWGKKSSQFTAVRNS